MNQKNIITIGIVVTIVIGVVYVSSIYNLIPSNIGSINIPLTSHPCKTDMKELLILSLNTASVDDKPAYTPKQEIELRDLTKIMGEDCKDVSQEQKLQWHLENMKELGLD